MNECMNRHYRSGMIELFKIIKGMYDPTCVPQFNFVELSEDSIRTKGNRYKLTQHHCHYDSRKYTYTNLCECSEHRPLQTVL